MAGIGINMSADQRLTQSMTLSPQQLIVVKMLEMPSMELLPRINEELQTNPMLEEGKDPDEQKREDDELSLYERDSDSEEQDDDLHESDDYDDYVDDDIYTESGFEEKDDYGATDDEVDYRVREHNHSADDEDNQDIPFSAKSTLAESLQEQIGMLHLSEMQRQAAEYVIGNIDDNGYLHRSTESLVDDMNFSGVPITDAEMEDVIRQLKLLDPAGIAAATLQECLLLQLKRKPQTEATQLATLLLTKYFVDCSQRRLERMRQRLNVSKELMQDAWYEIQHLDPKPGKAYMSSVYEEQKENVIPDFILENHGDELVISLNMGDLPDLRVSPMYKDMLQDYNQQKKLTAQDRAARSWIKENTDKAKWFIDAIRQRNETMMRTMQAILSYQYDFFVEGDEAYLKPMILQNIADKTGYDVSTISRVTNSKYIQTEFGMIALKHLFSESLTTTEGEDVSTKEIKKALREVINKEDKKHPYNDDELVRRMHEEGYQVARRTVAKYRDQMGIPVARWRKNL